MKISSTVRWGLGLAVIFAYEHLNRLSRTRYLPRLMILMGHGPLACPRRIPLSQGLAPMPRRLSDIGEEGMQWIWVWRGRRQGD